MSAPGPAPARVLGLDAARGLAVVAMVIAHAIPFVSTRLSEVATFALLQVNDLASPLFASSWARRACLPGRPPPWVSRARAGLASSCLGGPRAARALGRGHCNPLLLLIVGTPLLVLGTRWLLGLAAVLFVGGPPVLEAVTRAGGGVAGGQAPTAAWAANPLVQWLLLNTHYRVLSLLPIFLVGAVLARRWLHAEQRRAGASWVPAMVLAAWRSSCSGARRFSVTTPTKCRRRDSRSRHTGCDGDDIAARAALAGAVLEPLPWSAGSPSRSSHPRRPARAVIPAFPDGGCCRSVLFVGSARPVLAWGRFVGRGPVEWLVDAVSPSRRAPAGWRREHLTA